MDTPTPTTNTTGTAHTSTEANRIIDKDIRAKWDTAFKNKAEFLTQIVAKYGTEKGHALRNVYAVLKARLHS